MNEAVYYHNDAVSSSIIIRCIRRNIRGNVLELGAGVGNVTREVSKLAQTIIAAEPNENLFVELESKTLDLRNVRAIQADSNQILIDDKFQAQKFDTILYLNVLEHIEDDIAELGRARQMLTESGKVIIVVPAHMWLYSKIDKLTGHYRRYSRQSIFRVASRHFRQIQIMNFDSVGLIPYWLVYKLGKSTQVSGANAKFYSWVILRLSHALFVTTRGRLIGKNLIVVAQA